MNLTQAIEIYYHQHIKSIIRPRKEVINCDAEIAKECMNRMLDAQALSVHPLFFERNSPTEHKE